MKYIIIDDEYLGAEVLLTLISEHCPQMKYLGKASDVQEGIDLILKTKPEVVFLDIEMPGGSGFDLLTRIERIDFRVVFITSYDQYAIKAIKFNAFDYLLKPVIVEELVNCVTKLKNTVDYPSAKPDMFSDHQKLYINQKTKLEYVNFTDIIYLEGDGNYTYIHATSGKESYTSKTLKEYGDLLCLPGSGFLRIHKRYIINMSFVESLMKDGQVYVILKNGKRLEVSRRKRSMVLDQLKIGS